MYSIGLDISKASISVHISINSLDLEIDNTITALKALYSKLKKLYKKDLDKLTFVYEPTGSYSFLTKKFCASKNIKSFIINPKQSSNFAKALGHRSKSDKIDAIMLSKAIAIAREGEIRVPIIDDTLETIKELMSYYKFTVKQRVALSNHYEALNCKGGNKYTLRDISKRLKSFKNKELEVLDKIKEIIEADNKLSLTYKNIQTIPGIGKIAGIVLVHLFISYPNANKNQIVSLTGLDPIIKDSGTSVKSKPRISKAGIKLYRGSLFMATMVAIKYNEQMKYFYNRLKNNGKHSTVAQIAVMRKLIVIAHSLYKNNCIYDAETYEKACGKYIDKSDNNDLVA
ncbi:MAG: IS110 family transposase [Arcobacteraceae bacterium]|nr:IS110 family transposase [Arcobacteraceae bacterium]